MKSLSQILAFLHQVHDSVPLIQFSHMTQDSRAVTNGGLFCAVKGLGERHGHEFVEDAVLKGAALILLEQGLPKPDCSIPVYEIPDLGERLSKLAAFFYDYPSQKLTVIGVTGTNGKTSTTQYIAQALSILGEPSAVIGTVGNGPWGKLDTATHTTPDAVSLQQLLAEFVAQGIKTVAMEVSSHGLSQGRVAEVAFHAAIFTNLSHDHLDYHHDMRAYAEAKAILFAHSELKFAILNADDPYSGVMKQALNANIPCYWYSLGEHRLEVVVDNLVPHSGGFDLSVASQWGNVNTYLPLLGRFNVCNALASFTCLAALGYRVEAISKALSQLQGAIGRMERLSAPGKPAVIIDYAHTPDALEKALSAVREHCSGKLWVVFGCGGNRDRFKRPVMGEIAERLADQVVITADNVRFEDVNQIISDILGGLKSVQTVKILPHRRDAIHFVLAQAGVDDCILLAGKGHETYFEIKGLRQHFDEREVVREVWAGES